MLPDINLRMNVTDGLGRFVVHGGQLMLVFICLQMDSPVARFYVSMALAILCVVAWILAVRRWRVLSDTPRSQVATAAQGYVELAGQGKALAGLPLLSPLNALPCLWFRYTVEEKDSDGKWQHSNSQTSDASLIIQDSTGECLLDPEGAEVISTHKESWSEGDQRYTQWLLLAGDHLYALGQFVTRSGLDVQLDRNEDIKELLAEWKEDNPQLLKRFDLNRDGQPDMHEWELARSAARREVEAKHRELSASADLHMMQRPADGRLYVVSNLSAEKLALRYKLWAWAHLGGFFVALYAVVYFYQHGAKLALAA